MKKEKIVLLTIILLISACGSGGNSSGDLQNNPLQAEPNEELSAGAATGFRITAGAFSESSSNISFSRNADFLVGNDFFEDPWVIAPASTTVRDGLGSLFNVSACQSCHINDGRGHAPSENINNFSSLLFRTSRTDLNASEQALIDSGMVASIGDSTVGQQIQDRSIPGVLAEAVLTVTYETELATFSDGFQVELRRPTWLFNNNYGAFDVDTIFSARVAPPMIGLGMLEAIAIQDILALEDIDDIDNDGISGRINWVWNHVTQESDIGRFGWKSGQPTILQQSAAAFNGDLGLTTRIFPEENCLPNQTACLSQVTGKGEGENYEIRDDILDFVTFYSRNLAVPIRRNVSEKKVLEGKQLFNQANCSGCHKAQFVTSFQAENVEQSEQVIRPYTDLLLHDLGADLADFNLQNQAMNGELVEFQATAREWRTAPLWGLGLTQVVDAEATFLHDGRARTILEAVLWHGGEAEASKQQVLTFNQTEREALLAFLNSL